MSGMTVVILWLPYLARTSTTVKLILFGKGKSFFYYSSSCYYHMRGFLGCVKHYCVSWWNCDDFFFFAIVGNQFLSPRLLP